MHRKYQYYKSVILLIITAMSCSIHAQTNKQQCPALFHQGVLDLPFNPAFTSIKNLDDGKDLLVSSFFNTYFNDNGGLGFFHNDAITRIKNIDQINYDAFDPLSDVEILEQQQAAWPNEMNKAPAGFVPFTAILSPQGFHSSPRYGRLVMINMDDPNRTEYIIHQSDPSKPAFYHDVIYLDINEDGWLDIVTVRSSFKVVPNFYPPQGELVWFKNPGENLVATTPWQETILYGGPTVGFKGPDIHIESHDFENDGIPEFVATHFFTGVGDNPQISGSISIIGAPVGKSWADVNLDEMLLPRFKAITSEQGYPFGIELVDLNRDGRIDILASNHQPDNCSPATSSEIPGRVFALQMPDSGDIFNEEWQTHILLDNIRPQPSLPGPDGSIRPPGRLAPGKVKTFFPVRYYEIFSKPYIIVGGDEAGRVWVLTPENSFDSNNWDYQSNVIFDINATYGPNTTQTKMTDPNGISISTIGGITVDYDAPGPFGAAKFYIPVFEATDIHVIGYRPENLLQTPMECLDDVQLACPVAN